MEIKKTYTTNVISFKRIILKPKISDIFVKSVSVVTIDGEVYQLDVSPFVLDGDIVISNPVQNCMAVILSADHDYISSEEQLYDCLYVDVSRGGLYFHGILNTKPTKINVRDFISVISNVENKNNVIISADIGIRCYDSFDSELFNESVSVGLGDGREIISQDGNLKFESSQIRMFKDGHISPDSIESSGGKIVNYDKTCTYIYKPDYLDEHKSIKLSHNLSIDNNNNIHITALNAKYAEVTIRANILDMNNSSPIIKYIGVISRW